MNARMRSRFFQLLGFLLVAGPLLHDPQVRASVVVPLSLTELTDAATVIVDATVSEVRVTQGADGVERLVLLHVDGAWKGSPDASLYVRLAGGRLGRLDTRVSGVPEVTAGERLVWFLTAHPRGGYSVVGLYQGAMRTMVGRDGEAHVLAPSSGTVRGDVRRAPRRVADLATDVRALLAGDPR